MDNFFFHTPTKVYFGKDEELKIGKLIKEYNLLAWAKNFMIKEYEGEEITNLFFWANDEKQAEDIINKTFDEDGNYVKVAECDKAPYSENIDFDEYYFDKNNLVWKYAKLKGYPNDLVAVDAPPALTLALDGMNSCFK
mgnify:CR=1 FL=1